MSRGTILVTGDKPKIGEMLGLYLEREGYQVGTAPRGLRKAQPP